MEQISQELAPLGFKIKKSKVKLGSTEEYLEAISKRQYATTEKAEDEYVSAVAFDDVTSPDLLVKLVGRALQNPHDLLNEGFGRLSLGAIRRIRLNHVVAETKNYPHSPLEDYQSMLSARDDLIVRALDLFEAYLKVPDENWRAVWLLHMLEDVSPNSAMLKKRKDDLLHFASENASADLVRLRANHSLGRGRQPDVEDLHELGYLEGGARYYGSSTHP